MTVCSKQSCVAGGSFSLHLGLWLPVFRCLCRRVEEILVVSVGSVRRGGLLVLILVKAWNFIPFAISSM
jgi:hypothetical protein